MTRQPDVSTKPPDLNAGPALAVYNGTLYLAWMTASQTIYYATLPPVPWRLLVVASTGIDSGAENERGARLGS
jgi:hypothetical protein